MMMMTRVFFVVVVVVKVQFAAPDVYCHFVCWHDELFYFATKPASIPRLVWRCFVECDDHVRAVLVCYF